jgi:hypothetical protein
MSEVPCTLGKRGGAPPFHSPYYCCFKKKIKS